MRTDWERHDTRHIDEQWIKWIRAVTSEKNVVMLDMGPNWDSKAGPIGLFVEAQVKQLKAIKATIYGP